MPLTSDPRSTRSRHDFCLALKAARESRGLTVGEIAGATKIPASHFAELERNDLRHWPKGLFRRSFFRDYARMVGLPEAEACAEFVRLFPDDEGVTPVEQAGPGPGPARLGQVRRAIIAAWRQLAHAISHMFASDDDKTGQAETERDTAEWVTDARRVGKPRLRVRIKLPH